MYIKRGLIYLVFLLLFIPLIDSQGAVVPGFQCEDVFLGYCSEDSNLFCGHFEFTMINNGGFERSSNDISPNFFRKDSHSGSSYSNDAYTGEKSIRLTEQWASYDYNSFNGLPIQLLANADYLFFAFIKGSCQSPRVYSSTSQSGPADNHLCNNNVCTTTPVDNGWSRLVTQFNSNDIVTRSGDAITLPNLRVECADSTPFELFVDSMFLQPILPTQPELFENCQICGNSCPRGLSCSTNGQCEEDLSEVAINAVLDEDIDEILDLPPALKKVAVDQYSLNTRTVDYCEEGTEDCLGKTLTLSCSGSYNENVCKNNILEKAGLEIIPVQTPTQISTPVSEPTPTGPSTLTIPTDEASKPFTVLKTDMTNENNLFTLSELRTDPDPSGRCKVLFHNYFGGLYTDYSAIGFVEQGTEYMSRDRKDWLDAINEITGVSGEAILTNFVEISQSADGTVNEDITCASGRHDDLRSPCYWRQLWTSFGPTSTEYLCTEGGIWEKCEMLYSSDDRSINLNGNLYECEINQGWTKQ